MTLILTRTIPPEALATSHGRTRHDGIAACSPVVVLLNAGALSSALALSCAGAQLELHVARHQEAAAALHAVDNEPHRRAGRAGLAARLRSPLRHDGNRVGGLSVLQRVALTTR